MAQMHRKAGLLITGVLVLALTAGCGANGKSSGAAPSDGGQQKQEQTQASNDSNDAKKQTIQVYYSDNDLTVLVEQSRDITYNTDSEKITAALQALQSDAEGNAVSLWNKAEFLSAELKDSKVTIDIHFPEGSRLGAPGEVMALEALKKTLFQFNEVGSIEILVDGETVDSLMGHEELPHPIVK
ncbi:Lipoprotein LpqB, GerMN domain [Paenibacillus curdlanolyticus YK9]|uniref:Lipoprotein LpqB, GerMN domain n=1 Tax=Paenibacillus curdlanolyticus YK9 TaxID=717606 RepID=E0IC19_9BACL|nr:GerMN domain-containing protein [Paenibacillus curdlanolyticus]EFM09705.1 Lipoprotein LpqB, GerMN domain [Paenibacillus curdlanolyticus YK9]